MTVALIGIVVASVSAFLGHFVPQWFHEMKRWVRDREGLLREHERASAEVNALRREREQLYASLAAAAQGSLLNHELIRDLQSRMGTLENRADEQQLALADAVRYIADLVVHIKAGDGGDAALTMPPIPPSISDEVRAEIAARIAQRKHEHAMPDDNLGKAG